MRNDRCEREALSFRPSWPCRLNAIFNETRRVPALFVTAAASTLSSSFYGRCASLLTHIFARMLNYIPRARARARARCRVRARSVEIIAHCIDLCVRDGRVSSYLVVERECRSLMELKIGDG